MKESTIRKVMSEMGRNGGQSKSPEKVAAVTRNAAAARAAKILPGVNKGGRPRKANPPQA